MSESKNRKSRDKNKSHKSLSRLMAVQIFYQYNFFNDNDDLEKIKKNLVENYVLEENEVASSYADKIDGELLEILLQGLSLNMKKIDEELQEYLREGQKIETLDGVMLQILRLAAFEIKFMTDVPAKVVIDEYVGIAASFFDNTKVTFVNAIVDAMAKKNGRA
jgi:N utilization substance protein B